MSTTDATSDDGPSEGPAVSSERARWGLLLGASVMSVSLGAYELAPASVTTLIRQSLDIGPSAAGLIVSVMFGTAVVASIPVGVVLDRTNSRHAVAVAVGLLLVAGLWGWYAATIESFALVLASRVLGGLAYVVVWNAGIDVVGRSFEAERQATAVATFTASGPVGFAVGQAAAPLVAETFGWPAVFPVFTALSLVGLALFWPTSRGSGRASDTPTPTFADLSRVVTDRRVWLVGVLGFLGYSLYLFVNSWAPSYLTDELGLTLVASGALSALFPAVGVLSRISGGVLSDRLFGGRRRPVVLASFVLATPAVAAFTSLRGVPVVVAALLVAGFAIQLCLGLVFAYVRELVEPAVAATAVAFLTSIGLAGAFLAPIVGGALIDATNYGTAFLGAGALGLVGIAVAWFAPEP
ncbi:MFS transporter [Haloarchaeobius iranensis]|uniref:Nitrate/nitrite transporter NarK n=1 Tax=Haloarchaeobius iranensis TaxID=996166 RepID=A0A1H0A8J8_9EURY|nr:MFS transporter [Haloarchaeobius iranensis]SDN29795.1 Nitrate/nitrite transporter NarK [Haloarchaeobius iranensis]